MGVMNISEIQNMSSFEKWIELPNKITGGNTAWDSILVAFEFVVFIGLMRTGQDMQKSLITTFFTGTLTSLILYTINLIDLKLVIVNILMLAVMALAFLKHDE